MSTPGVPARTQIFAVAGILAVAVGFGVASPLTSSRASSAAQEQSASAGAELYATSCASCHGPDAKGTDDGPTLLDEGPAAVDWVLRTGRMPLSSPTDQAVARSKPTYDTTQIESIISHLQSLGMRGPAIPEPDLVGADIVNGGELFRRNCASCHQAVAQGGEVNGGRDAPSLQGVDALTIAEVLRVGPGVMPNFSQLDDQEVTDVSAWVTQVGQKPDDRGGAGIGHIGPVGEGLAIWLVIAIGVLGTLRWIGDKTTDEIESGIDVVAIAEVPSATAGTQPASGVGRRDPEKRSTAKRPGSWLMVLATGAALVIGWIKQRRKP